MKTQSQMSNMQVELLKLYSNNISDEDLAEVKKMLAGYFAKKLDTSFDNFVSTANLTPEQLLNWSNEHNRKLTK